jgi:hypothetical protein
MKAGTVDIRDAMLSTVLLPLGIRLLTYHVLPNKVVCSWFVKLWVPLCSLHATALQ